MKEKLRYVGALAGIGLLAIPLAVSVAALAVMAYVVSFLLYAWESCWVVLTGDPWMRV